MPLNKVASFYQFIAARTYVRTYVCVLVVLKIFLLYLLTRLSQTANFGSAFLSTPDCRALTRRSASKKPKRPDMLRASILYETRRLIVTTT